MLASRRPLSNWLRDQTDAVTVLAAQIITTASVASLAIVTAHRYGPSGRGILALVAVTASFVGYLSLAGRQTVLRRHLTLSLDPPAFSYMRMLAPRIGLAAPVGGLVSLMLSRLAADEVPSLLLAGTTAVMAADTAAWVASREILFARRPVWVVALADCSYGAVHIVIAAVALVFSPRLPSLLGAMIAILLTDTVVRTIVSARLTQNPTGRSRLPGRSAMLREGVPLLAVFLGFAVLQRADRLVLSALSGTRSVGYYSVAATVTEVLWLLPTAVGSVLFRRSAHGSLTWRSVRLASTSVLLVNALIAMVMAVAAPDVLRLVGGSAFVSAQTTLRLLLPGALVLGVIVLLAPLLAAAGSARVTSVATWTAATVMLALDFVLIPSLQENGAAIASSCAYAVGATLLWRTAASHFGRDPRVGSEPLTRLK